MSPDVRDLRDARIRRMLATGDINGIVIACDGLARYIARCYWMAGAEPEDLLQEVLVGIAQAARDYQPGHGASFWTFAEVCGRRRAMDAVSASRRQKHHALNHALSIDAPGDPTTSDIDLTWLLDGTADPCDVVICRERLRRVLSCVQSMSPLERECVERHSFAGEPFKAIGERKRVDNAIQRARRKVQAVEDAA